MIQYRVPDTKHATKILEKLSTLEPAEQHDRAKGSIHVLGSVRTPLIAICRLFVIFFYRLLQLTNQRVQGGLICSNTKSMRAYSSAHMTSGWIPSRRSCLRLLVQYCGGITDNYDTDRADPCRPHKITITEAQDETVPSCSEESCWEERAAARKLTAGSSSLEVS